MEQAKKTSSNTSRINSVVGQSCNWVSVVLYSRSLLIPAPWKDAYWQGWVAQAGVAEMRLDKWLRRSYQSPDANTAPPPPHPFTTRPPAHRNNKQMPFLIAAATALTNDRPTLARAEVVFVLPIETYDPTSERTQPADALRCFPTAANQMAAISSRNMTCWQGASSAYKRQKTSALAWLHCGCSSVTF